MGPKYEFTDETLNLNDHILHRIRRLSDGELGGWIESERNLSQKGKCWVSDEAKVYDEACVYGRAEVSGNAVVYGKARVYDNAKVYDFALVYDNAEVYEDTQVYNNARICDNAKVYNSAKVRDRAYVYGNSQILGNAEVYDDAQVHGMTEVYGNAEVCGNAQIYDKANILGCALVYDSARVYGNAFIEGHVKVYDEAQIYGKAKVHGETLIHNTAKIYGNADVYDVAEVYGDAEFCGNAKIHGNMKVNSGTYTDRNYYSNDPSNDTLKKAIQEFICKVVDTNKLIAQTDYTYIDRFINASIKNDIDLDTLSITCIANMRKTLIKLQKVEVDRKTAFKFIVDLTNEDDDDFRFRSVIKSPKQLNLIVQKTIEALKLYPKFDKYAEVLDELISS